MSGERERKIEKKKYVDLGTLTSRRILCKSIGALDHDHIAVFDHVFLFIKHNLIENEMLLSKFGCSGACKKKKKNPLPTHPPPVGDGCVSPSPASKKKRKKGEAISPFCCPRAPRGQMTHYQ